MKTIKDVKKWIHSLYDNYDIQFYPEYDFKDYKNLKLSDVQIEALTKQQQEATEICEKNGEKIEDIALEIYQEYNVSLESDYLSEKEDFEERTIINDLRYQIYTFIINSKEKFNLVENSNSFLPQDFKNYVFELSTEDLYQLKKKCQKIGFEKINLKESKIMNFQEFVNESKLSIEDKLELFAEEFRCSYSLYNKFIKKTKLFFYNSYYIVKGTKNVEFTNQQLKNGIDTSDINNKIGQSFEIENSIETLKDFVLLIDDKGLGI